jgi:hypothetical protein
MFLKHLPACPAKPVTMLLKALLDGVVALGHLLSAKPRCIARASLMLLRRPLSGLRSCIATSQNQQRKSYQSNSAHCYLQYAHFAPPQEMARDSY